MKQKIKIMNHKQQVSDEEIKSYMNFERVLEDRRILLHSSRLNRVYKWSIPLLTGALAIIGFLLTQNDTPGARQPMEQKPVESPQIVAPVRPSVDSSRTLKEESGKVPEPNRTANVPAPVIEKKSDEAPENIEEPKAIETGYAQAEPLNGYPDLYAYFNANLVYPASALKDSIQGVQTVSFVINKDGMVEQIQVEESLGSEFEKESMRLIENMPPWKPAKLDGKAVATRISIPITFKIQRIKN